MKKHPVFFMIVILLFTAMACSLGGGDDADEAESSNETTGNSESADSPGPATAAAKELEKEESSESAAESDPEATPSLAPTPTEEPPPTEAPTEEPTAVPTEEPAAEATEASMEDQGGSGSSGSGSATGTGSWGESSSGQQTACDHPYFPMREGSTWTFNNGADTMIWVITDVQGDLDNATAMMTNTIDNVIIEYKWDCSSSDGLSSFDFATFGIQDLGTEVTMDNMVLEGTFLLPPDQLVPGATWNMVLDGGLNITQEAGGQTMAITATLVSGQHFTVTGTDPVTFEDQTVDGLQIEESNALSIVMNVAGTEVAQDLSLGSIMQLGHGIGIVRQDYTSDFGSESQQLISYFIP